MSSCSSSIGHEFCNMQFLVMEREGHKAAPDAWRRSKNLPFKRKMARQRKEKI